MREDGVGGLACVLHELVDLGLGVSLGEYGHAYLGRVGGVATVDGDVWGRAPVRAVGDEYVGGVDCHGR